jgi:putative SOS response-associated peptidase YedK
MCGRYVIKTTPEELADHYGADLKGMGVFRPNYNAAPSQFLPVLLEQEGKREFRPFRWGLIPPWAGGKNSGYSMINARAESVADKKSFKKPFLYRRCVVPANGFFEWKKSSSGKIPYFISDPNHSFMNFAGIYESTETDKGETVNSFSIITTEANKTVQELHDRMPAMLLEGEIDDWLNPEQHDPGYLQEFLRPWPDDAIAFYRVSTDVNSVRNNHPGLTEPYRDLFS